MYNSKKRSIPTQYRSDMMRSVLEIKWAKTFDILGVEYYYEPQLYKFGEISYLPDFYLPQQDIFFEAKGVMDDSDIRKINALAFGLRKDVIVGYPNGTFQMADMEDCEGGVYGWREDAPPENENSWWVAKDTTILAKCDQCFKWHFHNANTGWICRICDTWSDDWHLGFHCGEDNLFERLEVRV